MLFVLYNMTEKITENDHHFVLYFFLPCVDVRSVECEPMLTKRYEKSDDKCSIQ